MAYRTLAAGLRVVEVPIEFVERERGDSKMSGSVATESLKRITRWGLASGARRSPRRSAAAMTHPVAPPHGSRRRRGCLLAVAFVVVPLPRSGADPGRPGDRPLVDDPAADRSTASSGAWLIRREGGRAWRALPRRSSSGRMPARELADGALVLVGGTLMLTPGLRHSTSLGILLILPVTRPWAAGC